MKNRIRKASAENAEAVAVMAAKMWTSHKADELAEGFAAAINCPDIALFLMTDNNKAVGFAQCGMRRDYVEGTNSSPVGYLEGIFVEEPYRKKPFSCLKNTINQI